MKRALWDLTEVEMVGVCARFGEPKYRGNQLFSACSQGKTLDEMSNLPAQFKAKLAEEFETEPIRILEVKTAKDGTEKMLFELADGNLIEGVFMRYHYGNTLCISTQVGCRMNCAFCASGLEGLVRNLSAGEMLGEVAAVNKRQGAGLGDKRAVTNVVLMGSGEPLDNYAEVVRFLRLVSCPAGLQISPRNISLSTCGLVPEMLRFADEGLAVNLTISLHAANDECRTQLMPINKTYPIAAVIAAAKHYFDVTRRRIIFEYSLIAGENCDLSSAKELIYLLRGLPCHVNLINLNFVKERGKLAADLTAVQDFLNALIAGGISATLRRSMGAEIEGACGQLRRRYLAENAPVVPQKNSEIAEENSPKNHSQNSKNAEENSSENHSQNSKNAEENSLQNHSQNSENTEENSLQNHSQNSKNAEENSLQNHSKNSENTEENSPQNHSKNSENTEENSLQNHSKNSENTEENSPQNRP